MGAPPRLINSALSSLLAPIPKILTAATFTPDPPRAERDINPFLPGIYAFVGDLDKLIFLSDSTK